MRSTLRACLFAAAAFAAGGTALGNDVFTSFEFPDSSGSFTLGTAPYDVTFAGGVARATGNPALHHSGIHSWLVQPGDVAEITFDAPAKTIELWYRDGDPDVDGTLVLYTVLGGPIYTVHGTGLSWTHVIFDSLAIPVGRIELRHNGAAGVSVIDDFRYVAARPGTELCFCTSGPCGNDAPASGCGNSTGAGGFLQAYGGNSTTHDTASFAAYGLPAAPALLFVGDALENGGAGVPFGDGLRCATGSIVRLGVAHATAGVARWEHGLAPTGGWSGGDTRYFQAWYRDPAPASCTGSNLSNAVRLTFTP